jgi:hypothetical protein
MAAPLVLPAECRVVRAMASSAARPVVRAQQLAFSTSVRGNALVSRTLETRAERATSVITAAYNNESANDEYNQDGYLERVVQVRRVTKVVKGGKQLSFRAVVSRQKSTHGWNACALTCAC